MWLKDCSDGTQAVLPVPKGGTLQLSFPEEITKAPWKLILEMQKPDGTLYQEIFEQDDPANGKPAITVRPKDKLTLVELQLPSAVVDESGARAAHAYWSILTA